MVECSPSVYYDDEPPIKRAKLVDAVVCPFLVIVDTREQAPWTFQNIVIEKRPWVVQRKVQTLTTGDYVVERRETQLCIERKSATDLVGSISSGNARFRREHDRMAEIVQSGGFACVVIEGSFSTICEELDAEIGRRVTSSMMIGVTASWPQKYQVPWFFAGDRRYAELLAFRIMLKFWKERKKDE